MWLNSAFSLGGTGRAETTANVSGFETEGQGADSSWKNKEAGNVKITQLELSSLEKRNRKIGEVSETKGTHQTW